MIVKEMKQETKECYGVWEGWDTSEEPVATHKDARRALDIAKEKGVKNPVVVFIRDPDVTYIFSVAG